MSRVYAVGLGPGDADLMTAEAEEILKGVDVIAGYTVYVDLVRERFPEKEFYTTGMKQEIDRCRWAIEKAASGKTVAMVCSGDAGVYGMAGLLFELADQYDGVDVEVIAGITAATSGAAVLGAPLGHDFCVISLSDLLTPWEMIEKRIRCAADGDFAICMYNPRSKKRSDYLDRACEIMMEYKSGATVCGWVKNIGREGQEMGLTTLDRLAGEPVDMFTTVFVGASSTKLIGGKMITPRGYEKHEDSFVRGND